MNICKKPKPKKYPELVTGHLYQHETGDLYLYSKESNGFFVNVLDGFTWPASQLVDVGRLTDVTDNYCLQEK